MLVVITPSYTNQVSLLLECVSLLKQCSFLWSLGNCCHSNASCLSRILKTMWVTLIIGKYFWENWIWSRETVSSHFGWSSFFSLGNWSNLLFLQNSDSPGSRPGSRITAQFLLLLSDCPRTENAASQWIIVICWVSYRKPLRSLWETNCTWLHYSKTTINWNVWMIGSVLWIGSK